MRKYHRVKRAVPGGPFLAWPLRSRKDGTMNRFALGVVGVLVALVLSGCDSPTSRQANADRDGVFANMSALQREILKDKRVTLAEYQNVVEDTLKCLEVNGFDIADKSVNVQTGMVTYNYSHDAPPPSDAEGIDDIDVVAFECEQRSRAVAQVFALQNVPSQEERDAAPGRLRDCLTVAGFTGLSTQPEEAIASSLADLADPRRDDAQSCAKVYYDAMANVSPGIAEAWEAYEP